MGYTVKQIKVQDLDNTLLRFIYNALTSLTKRNGLKYDIGAMPIKHITQNHIVLVCYRDETPIGFMIGLLNTIIFDINLTALSQLVLYAEQPKATYALLKQFIDIGKQRANYISMCVGHLTNIKESSLLKLGFIKSDTEYRMEV